MCPALIEYIKNRSVLILGFGREGRSTLAYIRKYLPEKPLAIADAKELCAAGGGIRLFTGKGYLDAINYFDLIIKSPGISLKDTKVANGAEITCQADLFLRFSGVRTIGVTGTKGKSTTSALLYEMLRAAGKRTLFIGNIGVPVLDKIDEAAGQTAVMELSCNQLEYVRASPHIAVLTNLYEDHLEHYRDGLAGYYRAKLNIVRYQTSSDFFIYNAAQDVLPRYIDFAALPSQKIPVYAEDFTASEYLRQLAAANPHLAGAHHRENLFLAAAAAKLAGAGEADILQAARGFKGLAHRMERVGVFSGVTFYDDSIATVPQAVMAAVETVRDVDTLIIGGLDRGIDYSGFLNDLPRSGVRNLICMPETGHILGRALQERGAGMRLIFVKTMEEAVKNAYEFTEKGKSCLLSPAASSYNAYRDFEEKGNHYKKLVESYKFL